MTIAEIALIGIQADRRPPAVDIIDAQSVVPITVATNALAVASFVVNG